LPVVVKPLDGNHGRGVSTNLVTREEVEAAYHIAMNEGSDVIVERFVPGDEHRLLVVGGKLVAAARGEALWITGDGKSTVEQLIDTHINSDPRRGETEDFPLNLVLLHVDHNIRLGLERQGYSGESVPPEGKRLLVARNGNVAFDITDKVHPEVAAAASLAARIVGLDIAGVDLVAEDISRPLEEQGGAIVEVNAGPGLLMHLKPADGQARPVGQAIVNHLFEPDDSGRIPVIGIAGSRGKTAVARVLAGLLQLRGAFVGLACSDGLFFHERQVEKTDCANWDSAHRILLNRSVDTAIIENGNRSILAEGLAYDRCLVGIVTNLDPQQLLPEFFIDDADRLRNVIRTQVDVVLPDGVAVLNAADPMVAGLAELCDGEVMYFAASPDAEPLAAHLSAQGRAVTVREGRLVLLQGAKEILVAELEALPHLATQTQEALENLLAAVGAAWALGMAAELIRTGIADPQYIPRAA
jgi:cyanophycin synthetase